MANPQKNIDWEIIEQSFRAGLLSIREIAKRHSISDTAIRKKAKKEGWTRSLVDKVRKAIAEKLVRSATVRATVRNEAKIVNDASDQAVVLIKLHRDAIDKLARIENKLMDELNDNPTKLYLTQFKGEIIEKKLALTVSEKALAANNLSSVQQRRITLERQAYNLGDKDDGNGTGEHPTRTPEEVEMMRTMGVKLAESLK